MTETARELADHSLRPLNDRVLVRQDAYKDRLASGLYIPQNSREGHDDVGTVLAIGAKVKVDVAVGDRVIFARRAGSAIVPDTREGCRDEEKDLLMLREEDLLAVVD